MADDKDKNTQQAPAVDNTSPEEKALADKLMAELMASGVDVNALAEKTPVAAPAVGSAPVPATPPAPAPTPAAPPPKPEPAPAPITPPPSTSSGPATPAPKPVAPAPTPTPVPTPPPPPPPATTPVAPVLPVTPTPASQPIASSTSTQDVESFIQSLDSTLARLNDSQFFVIRISKPVFYVLTAILGLLLIIAPRLPR